MTLDTAESMYKYFLSEVRKERTIVINPSQWTNLINPVLIDWTKTKLPEIEFNQKRIDDLEAIKVLTDGDTHSLIHAIAEDKFAIPYMDGKYMYGLSVEFAYADPSSPDTILRRVAGKILRSDKRVIIKNNPYRLPDDETFIYFEQRGGFIYSMPLEKEWNILILEYYRYPIEIEYSLTVDISGSFKPIQNKEIIDMAVTRYLEMASDQRIQTQPAVSATVPK